MSFVGTSVSGKEYDVHDIAESDWPSVRSDIEAGFYSDLEPVPVEVKDLVSLVETKPVGAVTTKLQWDRISAEEFERLLFNLISDAGEYVNPQWLMQTNASDRGPGPIRSTVLSRTRSAATSAN